MEITVKYLTAVKKITGISSEKFKAPVNCNLENLFLDQICSSYGAFKGYVDNMLNSNGKILFFLNNNIVNDLRGTFLNDGDVITIMSPIAGG
ncbi:MULTISPECIES: MoaD/ThiS family protein [unclassified Paenibacillus]|uniref:MoaD/ThiS family protein n=1 Tax=unclassified Paenibacillus TaxID=185978 RepID=UPI000FB3F9B7|nr:MULTISPECIES: MoaD/ThiS family protein [unclassified Paenibacillus]MBP1172909.1 molybdopterin converting factor small subunit [Paenibacillus sp. PvR133]MBP1310362.1 molybdopterin converting factor small subunit [Paenibacillus sp. 1182]